MTSFSAGVEYAGSRLLLFGEHLDPAEIDKISSIKANKSFIKGDHISKGPGVRKNGMWSINHFSDSKTLAHDLDFFIELFNTSTFPLTEIDTVESARISFWINNYTTGSVLEIVIGLPDLEKLSKIGAQLYITSFNDLGTED
jgi:Domain of unknown function (DUF4279)